MLALFAAQILHVFHVVRVPVVDPKVLQSGFGLICFCLGPANFGRIAHQFFGEFFSRLLSLFLQAFNPPTPRKSSPPKLTPKIVGIPLQFQSVEPREFVTPIFCWRGRSTADLNSVCEFAAKVEQRRVLQP